MTVTVPTYTAAQVRAAERPQLDAGAPLMQRAASALADVARQVIASLRDDDIDPDASHPHQTTHARHVLALVGSGDNGGDALYAAADLAEEVDVDVVLVGARVHEEALAAALGADARIVEVTALRDAPDAYDVVLDGILGIGAAADPALRGTAREAVEALLPAVNAGRSRVIAVDLPSGLHPDTGAAADVVLPASVTVTFGAVKAGLATGRGPELAGDIVLVDLGLGPALADVEPAGEAPVTPYRA